MTDNTATLARAITRASSRQTFITARLLVDKDLMIDFCRAYAYFRWADDIIDISSITDEERISFIERQKTLIDKFYSNERPEQLSLEEEMLADLIGSDRGERSGLQSFIRNMFAIIEFDALRKGRLIVRDELAWYTDRLGASVTDGLQYFIGNGHPYPISDSRYNAATAAHITHLLRDMVMDSSVGFINIPREYLEKHKISPQDIESPAFRAWVQGRVKQAREYFHEGKRYLNSLKVLRCTLAGHWYCARLEGVLDTIERDGYILRAAYKVREDVSTWLKILWLGTTIPLRHLSSRNQLP